MEAFIYLYTSSTKSFYTEDHPLYTEFEIEALWCSIFFYFWQTIKAEAH